MVEDNEGMHTIVDVVEHFVSPKKWGWRVKSRGGVFFDVLTPYYAGHKKISSMTMSSSTSLKYIKCVGAEG